MSEQRAAGPLGADVAVTHILVVTDPARSRDFWINVLGAEPPDSGGRHRGADDRGPWVRANSGPRPRR